MWIGSCYRVAHGVVASDVFAVIAAIGCVMRPALFAYAAQHQIATLRDGRSQARSPNIKAPGVCRPCVRARSLRHALLLTLSTGPVMAKDKRND